MEYPLYLNDLENLDSKKFDQYIHDLMIWVMEDPSCSEGYAPNVIFRKTKNFTIMCHFSFNEHIFENLKTVLCKQHFDGEAKLVNYISFLKAERPLHGSFLPMFGSEKSIYLSYSNWSTLEEVSRSQKVYSLKHKLDSI